MDKELVSTKSLSDRQELTLFLLFEDWDYVSTGADDDTAYVSFPANQETMVKSFILLRPSIARYFDIKETSGELHQMSMVEFYTMTAEKAENVKRWKREQKEWEEKQAKGGDRV